MNPGHWNPAVRDHSVTLCVLVKRDLLLLLEELQTHLC